MPHSCPACESPSLRPFYSVASVPTQSNLLMPTREIAVAQRRGSLQLSVCGRCGFMTNTAFDPASQELTGAYEATQGHSPTFSAFAKKLAARWTERYQLPGKTILEIGCGQGEFVSMLCEAANANGIGIDPILPKDKPADRVRWISDYYGPAYRDLQADFICCRHTLEHIAQPLAFLQNIRSGIGDRSQIVVAFEVPDTLRVLDECAFWDLYFEHCSYFTPGSLRSCFQRAGFEVIDQYVEFNGQYLILDARVAAKPIEPNDEPAPILAALERFEKRFSVLQNEWRSRLAAWQSAGNRVAVWGSGSKAVGFLTTLDLRDDVLPLVVDINPNKQGTYLPGTGQQIVSPEMMRAYKPDAVVVMNPIYVQEIGHALEAMGLKPEIVAL